LNSKTEYGEVQFYFQCAGEESKLSDEENAPYQTYALISLYGPPDPDMLEDSCHTLHACTYNGLEKLIVIPITSISAVISMQPLPQLPGDAENLWFVVEKTGLDDSEMTGYVDTVYD